MDEDDKKKRAKKVIENAKKLGAKLYICPEDIVAGNQKLNTLFVASIFNAYPGLDKLQMEMNEMILQNLQSKKKSANNSNNNNNTENTENPVNLIILDLISNNEKEQNKIFVSALINISQKLAEQNKELKEKLEI